MMCGSLERKAQCGRKANKSRADKPWSHHVQGLKRRLEVQDVEEPIFDSVRRILVRTPADGINRSILQSRLERFEQQLPSDWSSGLDAFCEAERFVLT
jgi:hypothetical protein